MSSFDLYDFNGSVKRNRPQEAMFNSLNSRDAFLQKLADDRRKRAEGEKRIRAATTIQAFWKGTKERKMTARRFRARFDTENDGDEQRLRLIAYFFSPSEDCNRLARQCTAFLSRPSSLSLPLRRYIARRALFPFLSSATSTSNVTSVIRFLEVTTANHEWRILAEAGFFDCMLSLFCSKGSPLVESVIDLREETRLPPYLTAIVDVIWRPMQFPITRAVCMGRLMSSLSHSRSSSHLTALVALFNPAIVRRIGGDSSLLVDSLSPSLNGGLPPLLPSPAPFHLCLLLIHSLLDTTSSVDELSALIVHLASLSPSPSQISSLPPPIFTHFESKLSSSFLHYIFTRISLSSAQLSALVTLSSLFPSNKDSLSSLANSHPFLRSLWQFLCTISPSASDSPSLSLLRLGSLPVPSVRPLLAGCVSLFSRLLSIHLRGTRDEHFDSSEWGVAFSLPEFTAVLAALRDVVLGLITVVCPDENITDPLEERKQRREQWEEPFDMAVDVLRQAHDKDQRLKFLDVEFWSNHGKEVGMSRQMFVDPADGRRGRRGRAVPHNSFLHGIIDSSEGSSSSEDEAMQLEEKNQPRKGFWSRKMKTMAPQDRRNVLIMRSIPFVVPFMQRIKIMRELMDDDKTKQRGAPVDVSVRRTHLYEDAFSDLNTLNAPSLRLPLRVSMHNWAGASEAGIDGGGIARELLTEVVKEALDVNRGLFTETHDHLLYPNPLAPLVMADFKSHFFFVGRLLGKCIYEGMLLDVRLADFFLSRLFVSSATDSDIVQLRSLDPVVYANLMLLRDMDAEKMLQLDLDFSVLVEELGRTRKVELVPGGSSIRVTWENRNNYLQMYANYFLHTRLECMVESVRAGISNVLNTRWLGIFSARELQLLVSGKEGDIDIKDLANNSEVYRGDVDESYVADLWSVLRSFSAEEQRKFIKFVTGCSRPPLGGFGALHPKVGIQLIPNADQRLPTSATCMNLLKLPRYKSKKELADKLSYAINAGAGFELS